MSDGARILDLRAPLRPYLWYLLGSLVFVILAVIVAGDGPFWLAFTAVAIAFFGYGAILFAIHLVPGAHVLMLTEAGMSLRFLGRRSMVFDFADMPGRFHAVFIGRAPRVAGLGLLSRLAYRPMQEAVGFHLSGEASSSAEAAWNRARYGVDAVVPVPHGMSCADFIALLDERRLHMRRHVTKSSARKRPAQ